MKNKKLFAGLVGISVVAFCGDAYAENILSRLGKAVTDAYPDFAPKAEITPLRIVNFGGVNYRIYGTDECQNPTGGYYPATSCVSFPTDAKALPVDRAVQLLVVRSDNPNRSTRMTAGVIRLGLDEHGERGAWLKSVAEDNGIVRTFDGYGIRGMTGHK